VQASRSTGYYYVIQFFLVLQRDEPKMAARAEEIVDMDSHSSGIKRSATGDKYQGSVAAARVAQAQSTTHTRVLLLPL
jgi:hypothetical protein